MGPSFAFGIDRPDHSARVSGRDHAWGHVAHHDAARADGGSRADRDARADDRSTPEPYSGPDGHRGRTFEPRAPDLGVQRVRGSVEMDAGPDLHVVTDLDPGAIEDHAVRVQEHPRADEGVDAVVTEER